MKTLLVLCLLLMPASVWAQSTAMVTANAPIYVAARESQTPLRVAAVGTRLRVLAEEGEWVQVEFQDPRFGRRVGYVHRTLVGISNEATMPMDLSVTTPSQAMPSGGGGQMPGQPAPGHAMSPQRPQSPLTRHITGRSGGTFGTTAAPLLGAEFSGDVHPLVQVYGSFDWHQNVAPSYFSTVGDIVEVVTGANDVDLIAPAFVGMGGVKIISSTRSVRPYGLGGFGVAYGKLKMKVDGEDITDLLTTFGGVDDSDLKYTKPMFEVGGGMAVPLGAFYIDASYRFRKALNIDDINMSGIYVSVGMSY